MGDMLSRLAKYGNITVVTRLCTNLCRPSQKSTLPKSSTLVVIYCLLYSFLYRYVCTCMYVHICVYVCVCVCVCVCNGLFLSLFHIIFNTPCLLIVIHVICGMCGYVCTVES